MTSSTLVAEEFAWHSRRFRLAVGMELRRTAAQRAGDRAGVAAAVRELAELLDFTVGPGLADVPEEARALLAAAGVAAEYVRHTAEPVNITRVAGGLDDRTPAELWEGWSIFSGVMHAVRTAPPTVAEVIQLRPGGAA